MEIHRDVPNGPTAAMEARRLVDSLPDEVPDAIAENVRLVLSELVTNSFKHAGNPPGHPIKVTLKVSRGSLRLEVVDRSIFDPTPETGEELREAKWGLLLLDRLVDNWGRISEGGIWAEFRVDQPK